MKVSAATIPLPKQPKSANLERRPYRVLATDFDGTIAEEGTVAVKTVQALERFRSNGGKVILVTGREMPDLSRIFHRFDLFDVVVAENGGLLYWPSQKIEQRLAEPPSPGFVEKLMERGVGPISVGHVIVATWEPQQAVVLDVIREMGLELQVIFNKGAVMILPAGINKASGLNAALEVLKISPGDVVGVGDAENDHAFLDACGFAVAVANALPAVKERADHVTRSARGAGVVELIDEVLLP